VTKFKYLGTTVTDQDFVHEETKNRLNSGNACYTSESFVFRLSSENLKIIGFKYTNHNFTCCFTWVWNSISHT